MPLHRYARPGRALHRRRPQKGKHGSRLRVQPKVTTSHQKQSRSSASSETTETIHSLNCHMFCKAPAIPICPLTQTTLIGKLVFRFYTKSNRRDLNEVRLVIFSFKQHVLHTLTEVMRPQNNPQTQPARVSQGAQRSRVSAASQTPTHPTRPFGNNKTRPDSPAGSRGRPRAAAAQPCAPTVLIPAPV